MGRKFEVSCFWGVLAIADHPCLLQDGSGAIETTELRKGFKMMGIDDVQEHTLGLVIKFFDSDGSGEIDCNEFIKMTQALCNSAEPGGIEAALEKVKGNGGKGKIASPSKVVHEAGERVNYDEMTQSQLVNNLEMLKLRLKNRCVLTPLKIGAS